MVGGKVPTEIADRAATREGRVREQPCRPAECSLLRLVRSALRDGVRPWRAKSNPRVSQTVHSHPEKENH